MQLTLSRPVLISSSALIAVLAIFLVRGGSQGEFSPPPATDHVVRAVGLEQRMRTAVTYNAEGAEAPRSEARCSSGHALSTSGAAPTSRGVVDSETRVMWQDLMAETLEEDVSEKISDDLGWILESDVLELLEIH